METTFDIIVVGGGPCGSFAALNLAKHGVKVAVFEEHAEIGLPSHCAGHLSINGLKRLGLFPLPKHVVENRFRGAVFHPPSGREFRVRFSSPVTCAVDRALFDKFIADMAQSAGAYYFLNSRVESLNIDEGKVSGVTVKRRNDAERFASKIVVDAEGVVSRLLRQAGLSTLDHSRLLNGIEAEVADVKDVEEDVVEVFLGKEYAPCFFAWLIPKRGGKAKIGLAAKTGNPKELLLKLMTKHVAASKKLSSAKILQTTLHPVTLGGPIAKTCSNGFLAVGDVASHVKPTTGGGVIWGLTCAATASEVICEALEKADFSSDFLVMYEKRCKTLLGFDAEVMGRLRKTLDASSDEQVDDAINFCSRIGLDKTLQKLGDIDFQAHAFLHVLHDPRLLTAMLYFFLLYLSANP
jgi:geranylgeranyl reductase family protein